MPNLRLNPRQEMFCQHYLTDLNATNAYLKSGYRTKSNASARKSACLLLKKAKIRFRLYEIRRDIQRRLGTLFPGDLDIREKAVLNQPLSEKEMSFVFFYAMESNATESGYKAGYKAKNRAVMGVIAHRLLKKGNIRVALSSFL